MSKTLNNKKEYDIDREKLHSFIVCCDRIDIKFHKIMQYTTQLDILSEAYYAEQYDSELICDCICSSVKRLSSIVSDEYAMFLKYRELHNDIAGIM